ncbi:hypothetical protein D6C95_08752 [Aureobasidium pullulans]|nr:hypothetical protein D6C95_08752 [Aureobasidium pullulans]TIA63103.1 hypothetical protein D6C76_09876 [Aureobasidium pullulans]
MYNANLVEQANDRYGGSIGFIDDYTTWVVGPTAVLNTQKIQRTVIPKAEAWARESGATFEAEKTGVKILGVTLDGKLRMDAYVERAKADKAAVSVGGDSYYRLRGIIVV